MLYPNLYSNLKTQSLIRFSLIALFVAVLSACGGGGGGSSSSGGNPDIDGDGVENTADNCSGVANADQSDVDGDGRGDACDSVNDLDTDGDGVANALDNCPANSNADQADSDNDGKGNVCDGVNDIDTDNDGIENTVDNCPTVKNPDQNDLVDGDGIGDICDNLDNNCLTDITKRDGCGYTSDPSNAVTYDGIWLGFIDGIENEGTSDEVRVKMRFMATLLTVPNGFGAYSGKTYAFGCALANVPVTVQQIDSTHSTLGFNFSAPGQPLFNYDFSLNYEKSLAKTKQMQGVVSGGGGNSFSGSVTLKRIEAGLTILDLGGNLPKFPGDLDLTIDDVTTNNMKVMCYAQAERRGYADKQGSQLAFTQKALAVGGIDGIDLDKVISGQTDYFERTAAAYSEITEWEGITNPDILFNVRNEVVSASKVGFAYFDTNNQSTARLVKDYFVTGPFNEETGQMIPLAGGLGMETRTPDDALIHKADFSFSVPLN